MAVSIEAIEAILNFDTSEAVVEGQSIKLGRVNKYNVVYGNYTVQERLISTYNPQEPLVFSWRTKPVVALEDRDEEGRLRAYQTLAYRTDIQSLEESVVLGVVAALNRYPNEN